MTQENGIVYGMPRARYELVQRDNWSNVKLLARSPAAYHHAQLEPEEDTAARKLGRVCHIASLEPERFRFEVAVWRGKVRRGKEWEAFKEENAGREWLLPREHDFALAIQKAVRTDATAAPYLAGGKSEVTILWTHTRPAVGELPGYSLDCKARPDFIATARPAIVDLKTTRDASPEGFGREVWRYLYHGQAAYYVDGHEAATGTRLPYVIVAVETKPPHIVQVYRVPEHVLETGRELYRALLDRLHFCREHATWPTYFDGEAELSLPRWASPGADDEDPTGLGLDFTPAAQDQEHA